MKQTELKKLAALLAKFHNHVHPAHCQPYTYDTMQFHIRTVFSAVVQQADKPAQS